MEVTLAVSDDAARAQESHAQEFSERLRRAADPSTPPADLADLAYRHAELRPLVAGNPAAYQGLLEWLGSLGDPVVDAVIAARGPAE
jgi:hypothetical protein